MKLSAFGKLQMNNPARAALQRRYTAKHMLRLGGGVKDGYVLEVGCGRGVGVEIILEVFGAARVEAFDLDPELVRLAERRLRKWSDRVRIYTGDAGRLTAAPDTLDAVFDFGVLHQMVNWRDGVAEIARVLKPGGRYYFEAVASRLYRFPMNLAMERGTPDVRKIGFNKDALFEELRRHGIELGANYLQSRSPLTAVFVGDLIGVGRLKR